ncbi:MAG: hypothetical protein LBH44_07505 [Treponema sp.]|nr:hypothetical protein [Treponema sp.]
MKPIEISDDLFCGRMDFCDAAVSNGCEELSCGECHRKWPTPEQFKEEYGYEWPNDGPVWYRHSYNPVVERNKKNKPVKIDMETIKYNPWYLTEFASAIKNHPVHIVCACTPWGKPPDDWRPK